MKKSILLVAALLAVSVAAAQTESQPKPQTEPQKNVRPVSLYGFAPGARFLDRVWFSVVYTPKFNLSESLSKGAEQQDLAKTTAHNYALEAGYMLLPRLSLGVGVGYERYWIGTGTAVDMVPLYLQAHYFYGKHGAGLFNYARLGVLLSADEGAKSGFTGGAGVGYRLMLHRRFGVDFKLGYDYAHTSIDKRRFASQQFDGTRWSRHSLSLGVGLVF